MEFALPRPEQYREPDALLLEEPEDHLSHVNLKKLMNTLAPEREMQRFVSRHSSHISSRPDLRSAILPGESRPVALRVILAEGDAGFILTDAFYRNLTGRAPEEAGVHIVAIGGTRYRCYLELAHIPGNRVAALRDNDGDCQRKCVEHFADMTSPDRKVYGDEDASRYTFEICVYRVILNAANGFLPAPAVDLASRNTCSPVKPGAVFCCWRKEHG
ncbi:TOPRIM nucleotidyl transferase/hydrolase domain-containing protein [Pantoea sp. OXWO6B1]|uniref:TOPRIM nucleotidyl transferase/hydrolase domain-containing protein n=1 Tax=Pantoea sp. OXWO6B1 TaxID=1835724 RepID=UPI000B1F9CB4